MRPKIIVLLTLTSACTCTEALYSCSVSVHLDIVNLADGMYTLEIEPEAVGFDDNQRDDIACSFVLYDGAVQTDGSYDNRPEWVPIPSGDKFCARPSNRAGFTSIHFEKRDVNEPDDVAFVLMAEFAPPKGSLLEAPEELGLLVIEPNWSNPVGNQGTALNCNGRQCRSGQVDLVF